jgi:galactokinase
LARAVENDYIGSPCGILDQVMILFARGGMGTHFSPAAKSIRHIPLGDRAPDFRFAGMDTGTERPGLEKSTYKIRRAECERFVSILKDGGFGIECLAEIKEPGLFEEIRIRYGHLYPDLCSRLRYIFHAQQRFDKMIRAWTEGDIPTVGRIFREDGIGLRDDYRISGSELETMCDIARTIPGVYGERMLGGGDKGVSGALVAAEDFSALRDAVDQAYPRSHPEYKSRYAVHAFNMVDGIRLYEGHLG